MPKFRSGQLHAAVAAFGAMTASGAGAQSTNYLDVGAAAGYSSNPDLSPDNSDGSAFGRVFVTGQHSRESERTVYSLAGYAEQSIYGGDNDSNRLASANASIRHRASETLNIHGLVGASVDSGGQLLSRFINFPQGPVTVPVVPASGTAQPASVPAQVVVFPPGFGNNPTFIGLGENHYSVHGLVGAGFNIGPRDSLEVHAGTRHSWFGGDEGDDFTSYSLGGGWDRVLSDRTTIGAGIESQRIDYGDGGNAVILSPRVRVRTSLAENWVASAAAGASIVDDNNGVNEHETDDDGDGDGDNRSIGLYVNGSLCRSIVASTFCATVQRNALPSSDGGIVNATNAGLNYAQRLTVNDSFQASANLVRYSGDDMLANSTTSFATADVGYNRRLSGRLWSSAQVGARVADRREADSATDLNASVSIRYRFGDSM